ncbi:MAG: MBL fold metallo-hydrolase [Candidatus Gastranaerophilales bacterium]|nr:MBL fold metallo-hydrolase [Candidatus Gastranaerophilales bacterium]
MQITVLVDNNTLIGRYFQGEPALSFLIEENGKNILFDTGYSDAFINNARKMGINLYDLDYVVLSHGHLDHTWGLSSLIKLFTEATYEKISFNRPIIIAHPMAFASKSKNELKEVGSILSDNKISRSFNLNLSKNPLWITEKLVFLGEVERTNKFEGHRVMGQIHLESQTNEDDYMKDDTAIAYKSTKGIVIITGCSHSGICNIIEQAKDVCQDNRVLDVIGGFHLLNPPSEQMKFTLDYFKKLKPETLHPCHCTDLYSKIALSQVANIKEVGIGLRIEY